MNERLSTRTVTELFAEYVEELERGASPDQQALLAAAGEQRKDLAWRFEAHDQLQRFLGAPDGDSPGTSDLPEALGRFKILRELESGGQGRVLLAEDAELGRQVALKVLGGELRLARADRAVVQNEARSLALLEHSGVVSIFDVAAVEGFDFLVMEHIEGPSLQGVIAELAALNSGACGPDDVCLEARRLLPYSERLRALTKIAEALAYAHDRGVLHRDVTPSNVLFSKEGAPKLIDFGLAHLERAREEGSLGVTQTLVGKAAYLAPEQIESGAIGVDPRSDQFTFGVLAYEFLGLENPFARETRTETLNAVTRSEPRSLRQVDALVPAEAARVVQHCMERAPQERYSSMSQVAADLRAVSEHRAISLPLPGIRVRLQRFGRRHRRWILLAGTALFMVLLTVLGTVGSAFLDADRELALALEQLDGQNPTTPAEFIQLLEEIQGLRGRVERHRARALHGALGSSTHVALAGVTRRLSNRLAVALASDESESSKRGAPFQHQGWSRAVQLESRVCPECPANMESRDRGRLFLPAGSSTSLQQQVELMPMSPISFLEVRAEQYPTPGYYRVQSRTADRVLFEIDLVIGNGWNPARVVQRPALQFRPELTLVKGEAIESLPGFGLPAYTLSTNDFRLSAVVTEAAVADFCARTGFPLPTKEWADSELPANASWNLANEYAAWVGARLPSLQEALLAHAAGVLDVPGEIWAEWLCDSRESDPCRKLEHGDIADMSPTTGHHFFGERIRAPSRSLPWENDERFVGFRIAVSAEVGCSPSLQFETR